MLDTAKKANKNEFGKWSGIRWNPLESVGIRWNSLESVGKGNFSVCCISRWDIDVMENCWSKIRSHEGSCVEKGQWSKHWGPDEHHQKIVEIDQNRLQNLVTCNYPYATHFLVLLWPIPRSFCGLRGKCTPSNIVFPWQGLSVGQLFKSQHATVNSQQPSTIFKRHCHDIVPSSLRFLVRRLLQAGIQEVPIAARRI